MIDLTSIGTYTDQQILNVLRLSLVNSALATEYSVNGRHISRMSAKEIQSLINVYEWRIARAGSGLFSVARFRNPE